MEMIDAYEMVDDPDDCEIVVIEASAATVPATAAPATVPATAAAATVQAAATIQAALRGRAARRRVAALRAATARKPCPCNSGRPFKRCCAAAYHRRRWAVIPSRAPRISRQQVVANVQHCQLLVDWRHVERCFAQKTAGGTLLQRKGKRRTVFLRQDNILEVARAARKECDILLDKDLGAFHVKGCHVYYFLPCKARWANGQICGHAPIVALKNPAVYSCAKCDWVDDEIEESRACSQAPS